MFEGQGRKKEFEGHQQAESLDIFITVLSTRRLPLRAHNSIINQCQQGEFLSWLLCLMEKTMNTLNIYRFKFEVCLRDWRSCRS